MHKETGETEHAMFLDLPERLDPGDLLVLNDTRVLRARLFGRRALSDGSLGGKVEVLLLREIGLSRWLCMCRPGRRTRPGHVISFGDGAVGRVEDDAGGGRRVLRFEAGGEPAAAEDLERIGTVPLPPYIKAPLDRPERYQTVYADKLGSVAAPTAGLHFTPEVFGALRARGIRVCKLTHHVGPGTFVPVRTEYVRDHSMHEEEYEIPEETVKMVSEVRARGGRIVAAGTTVVRALESAWADERPKAQRGTTSLFIHPGYEFRAVTAMLTNFHLPRSTLLMLVCAFAGREKVLRAYEEAIALRYRFYSFGDAMLIL